MTDPIFDHEKLDVYRLALEYVAESFLMAKRLSGLHRHAPITGYVLPSRSHSTSPKENGKRSLKDRARVFDITRGSAPECAAIQDGLVVSGGIDAAPGGPRKAKRKRIVAMLTRLAMRSDRVDESAAWHDPDIDYEHEHEHRFAEHGDGRVNARFGPEPSHAPEWQWPALFEITVNSRRPVMRVVTSFLDD